MKKVLVLLLVLVLVIGIVGCSSTNDVNDQEVTMTKDNQERAQQVLGDGPLIEDFTELKNARYIVELLDDPDLISYIYTRNIDGKYIYEGRGFSFGVPYSTQITNPEFIAFSSTNTGAFGILPQADPSLIYKPGSSSATWYMMINEDTGEPKVEYFEQKIRVLQDKLPLYRLDLDSTPTGYVEGFVNPREAEIQSMMTGSVDENKVNDN